MIFNSIEFLLFFPIVFILYWVLQGKKVLYQNCLLLAASYVFYGWWDWRFLGLIALSTVADFILGFKIEEANSRKEKRIFLGASLAVNLGLLGFFKYYNFFVDSFREGLSALGFGFDTWSLSIILPVGISFYTFQTLSYSIDIYKGKIKPTKDFIAFAAFVSFFPQLVAGPIERAGNLLPQFVKNRNFNFETARIGTSLICYGLFKKMVVADRLALYVNSVFENLDDANSLTLSVAIVFFSFQIYCDFSGYSLIARGTAKLLGIELMVNFNRPYLAENIAEFWHRWHISLSTWFRDYVYIPLGGSRVPFERHYVNIMIVFLVSGLWHGANWTFVVWGGLHGLFLVIYTIYSKIFGKRKSTFPVRVVSIMFTYALVCFAWIFFRAESIDIAFTIIKQYLAFDFSVDRMALLARSSSMNFMLCFFAIGLLFLTYLLPKDLNFKNSAQHIAFSTFIFLIIVLIGNNGEQAFIYFQF